MCLYADRAVQSDRCKSIPAQFAYHGYIDCSAGCEGPGELRQALCTVIEVARSGLHHTVRDVRRGAFGSLEGGGPGGITGHRLDVGLAVDIPSERHDQ